MRDYTAPISGESPVEVAIIDTNTLARIGLQRIIEEVMPTVVVRGFGSLEELIDDTPYAYAYCFVSASIYLSRINYFRNHHLRAIVLVGDDTNPTLQGIPTLNTMQGEQALARSLMALQGYGDSLQAIPKPPHGQRTQHELSAREVEVLALIARGLMNKQIADRLHISLTTVISHRKNITEKLGIKSVPGLTIYAVLNGYVDAADI